MLKFRETIFLTEVSQISEADEQEIAGLNDELRKTFKG